MIYVCNICGKGIHELNTPGDEVNKDFACTDCAKEVHSLLREAKKIQVSLLKLFEQRN